MTKHEKTARRILADHADTVDWISRQLATDYETPAQRSINAGFARMGIDRFPAGHDLWEMVTAIRDGLEYVKPAAHLIRRWACY